MKIDKLALILVVVGGAILGTLWLGSMILASLQMPLMWPVVIVALVVGYIAWRVLEDRLSSAEDDHYDKIEK
ncbi:MULTISPECIES: hypothetical protein [Roseobacteraceae]|jgi:uncharacterized membrane protein|uniref:Uncharacterized protein n=1 Tax=Celeribacter baekdonensis B30 TaxID=1208323 RepID=K2JCG8_9RHOB|nr:MULTISPECIES: hypothetical protein [Roseobacteraceae]EKE72703.1 hypothetical protein B30_06966 [Celeribacter baekdonensis B30]KAB6715339.1 hypothetical protein C8029_15400 [Roseobacter sp. TSBP12]|tara:strand:+ start:12064 stop:12279 length:216 start_codon:yes stop_codon:yes gene_type:complete